MRILSMSKIDPKKHNERAWDINVDQKNRWTIPASKNQIDQARKGHIEIFLTPSKPVPFSWLGNLSHRSVLGLASGGGQQGPILAAAGANTTIIDLSSKQLEQDKICAREHGLHLRTIHTSADDLKDLQSNEFDLIINPVSNCFFENLDPVWKECQRVLKPGGEIIWGFNNPLVYLFDFEKRNQGELIAKYPQPFSDLESLTDEERAKFIGNEIPLEYGHSLTDQIGGLLKYGFQLLDMYEDFWGIEEELLDRYFPQFIAARARKV